MKSAHISDGDELVKGPHDPKTFIATGNYWISPNSHQGMMSF